MHSGERPYSCSWEGCGYAASQKGHLQSHMLKHTGQRPFKCTIGDCDFACTRSWHLARHTRKHELDSAAAAVEASTAGFRSVANVHSASVHDAALPPQSEMPMSEASDLGPDIKDEQLSSAEMGDNVAMSMSLLEGGGVQGVVDDVAWPWQGC